MRTSCPLSFLPFFLLLSLASRCGHVLDSFLGLRVAENVFKCSFQETDKLLLSKPSIIDELAMSAEITNPETHSTMQLLEALRNMEA